MHYARVDEHYAMVDEREIDFCQNRPRRYGSIVLESLPTARLYTRGIGLLVMRLVLDFDINHFLSERQPNQGNTAGAEAIGPSILS
jgi:hypothetical protein